jgi:hypothetical protein
MLDNIEKLSQARNKIWTAISDYEQRARNFRSESENFLTTLATETGKFIDNGVVVVSKYEDENWQRRLGEPKFKYFKEVAKSLKRPFIHMREIEGYVERVGWSVYWLLSVPKKPRLQNIVAGLLMACDNTPDAYVKHIQHDRSWEFIFTGSKGKELREYWLQSCRVDPVFRICLDLLPVKVT